MNFLAFYAVLAMLVYIIFALNVFVYFNVQVQQSSMEPTVYEDDMLVANRLKKPVVGDIVIIDNLEEYLLIKRVIATGGSSVKIADGAVWVDGVKLEEDYLPEGVVTTPTNGVSEWTLNDNEVFFLGDNRRVSRDSRSMGVCTEEDIIGVVEPWSVATKGVRNFLYKIFSPLVGSCNGNRFG